MEATLNVDDFPSILGVICNYISGFTKNGNFSSSKTRPEEESFENDEVELLIAMGGILGNLTGSKVLRHTVKAYKLGHKVIGNNRILFFF